MNPLVAVVIGLFLSLCLITSAQAAPAPAKAASKQGMKNAKKVMVAKLQQEGKMRSAKKHGIAVRQQKLANKAAAQ